MNSTTIKLASEFFGTAVLVFLGCGSVAIGGFGSALPMGALPIALAFGLTVTGLAYAIGPISGCHINPAATIGLHLAGRFPRASVLPYICAQLLGSALGAGLLVLVLSGKLQAYDIAASGLGQNGWGEGYLGGYGLIPSFIMEFVATFIFMIVILGATSKNANSAMAPIAIGSVLTVIIFVLINVTGVSLNPARSFGPAVFIGGKALGQLWLFIVAPTMGAALAGLWFRSLDSNQA